MHDTAFEIGKFFFETYWQSGFKKILDVGSLNVNGTLRDVQPPGASYIGVDLSDGPGVDVVLNDSNTFPFDDGYFDVVVSTSCFEHDQFFWLTFAEMLRVVQPSGYIYINAPSNGSYHGYPYDNWRFYPDCGLALEAWSQKIEKSAVLVESFVGRKISDIWCDLVMVFARGTTPPDQPSCFLHTLISGANNIRVYGNDTLEVFREHPQDMVELHEAQARIRNLQKDLAQKTETANQLKQKNDAVVALTKERDQLKEQLSAAQQEHKQVHEQNTKLKQEKDQLVNSLEQTNTERKKANARIEAMQQQTADANHRRQLLQEELARAEAQIDLIKDLLLREQGLGE